jgi:bifunctional non-homologous end joining protein LigD
MPNHAATWPSARKLTKRSTDFDAWRKSGNTLHERPSLTDPCDIGSRSATARRDRACDGEAVVCGPDGVAIFDALHRRGTVTEAMMYAFDLLELDGEDLRGLPLRDRKRRLARLLGRRRLGIVLSQHTADDGAAVFRQACKLGLEDIVSKWLSAPYRSGRSRNWLKVKNPDSPAMTRHREERW